MAHPLLYLVNLPQKCMQALDPPLELQPHRVRLEFASWDGLGAEIPVLLLEVCQQSASLLDPDRGMGELIF